MPISNDMSKSTTKPDNPAPEATAATHRAFAEGVLRAESEAVLNVLGHLDVGFDKAVELIAGCSGNVIVSGLGKSGIIAQKIVATLASTGQPSHFLHPSEAMHGDLGRIRPDDVALLLSYSGNGEEVLALAALLRQDNVPVVAMCGKADSHLGRICDLAICVGDVTEACPHNLAPTASTTAMLALGDALALAVSRRRDFSAEDFHRRHPGGQLGRQLIPITQVLRFKAGENLPLVRDDKSVRQVLTAANETPRRAGAVLLVDSAGKLSGIFTDADLRRLVETGGPDAMDQPITGVMTRTPRTVRHTAAVRDAVQLVREIRVDELPVVDDDDRPVGLIDVQDLIAMKVIEQ